MYSQLKALDGWVERGKFRGEIIFLLTAFLVFHPALIAEFFFDDRLAIYENPFIVNPNAFAGLYKIWIGLNEVDFWPVTTTFHWAFWHLFGKTPVPAHLTTLFVHCFNGILIWKILQKIQVNGAFLIAFLFLIHPVNAEIPPWAIQLKTALAGMFMFLSLLKYLDFYDNNRFGKRLYKKSVFFFALSLLSKTSSIMYPFVILGVSYFKNNKITFKDLQRSIPFFLLSLICGLLAIYRNDYHLSPVEDLIRTDSFASRFAIAGMAVFFYIGKIIWPFNVSFMYPLWKIDTSYFLNYIPSLFVFVILFFSFYYRKTWGKNNLILFCYYLLMIFPVLGFYNIYYMKYSLVSDHWQYLGVPAIIIPIVFLLGKFLDKKKTLFFALFALISTVLAYFSFTYCQYFKTAESIYQYTLTQNPGAWMIYNNLGNIYSTRQEEKKALSYYQKSLELKKDDKMALGNAGKSYLRLNQPDLAINYFEKILSINKQEFEGHSGLCSSYLYKNEIEKAEGFCFKAVEINPREQIPLLNLGNSYLKVNQWKKAQNIFESVLAARGTPVENALNGLATAIFQQGRVEEGIELYKQATLVNPRYLLAFENLTIIYAQAGRNEMARIYGEKALMIDNNSKIKVIMEKLMR